MDPDKSIGTHLDRIIADIERIATMLPKLLGADSPFIKIQDDLTSQLAEKDAEIRRLNEKIEDLQKLIKNDI